jgi:hypothetical protein
MSLSTLVNSYQSYSSVIINNLMSNFIAKFHYNNISLVSHHQYFIYHLTNLLKFIELYHIKNVGENIIHWFSMSYKIIIRNSLIINP